MSLSSTLCALLVLGPVMKETDLKANQNCRSLFQDVPREGVEIYSRCGFGAGFGLVWNGFFGLDVSSLSTSCFAASTSSSSASSTNSSSVKI